MRALRSPWPLGVLIVVLSVAQYLAIPAYDDTIRRLAGEAPIDVDEVKAFVNTAVLAGLLVQLLSLLWLVFWKYPTEVRLSAWCRDMPGRSGLWTFVLGASAAWNLWDAVAEVSARDLANGLIDLGWVVCMIALRGVVVSRLKERAEERAAALAAGRASS